MTQQLDIFGNAAELGLPSTVRRSRVLRDRGIKASADHAEAVAEGWQAAAYRLFCAYARTHREFMTEDVRVFARNNALLDEPPDARAWGAVAIRARRAGLVRSIGYACQRDPKSHRSPKPIWSLV